MVSLTQVVLKMPQVRALLGASPADGGPCEEGVGRLLRRFGICGTDDLTAEMLRTALKEGATYFPWDDDVFDQARTTLARVTWNDYSWFLVRVLPDSRATQEMLMECVDVEYGEEWGVLSRYFTLEVTDE